MIVNVMSYNIHGGKDIKNKLTLYGISNIIRESKADIIGLQEVDLYLGRSYFINEIKYLGKRLNMYYTFGPNIKVGFGSFGNGILSKFPIIKKRNHHMFSKGEIRGILTSLIEINNKKIWFLNTHLGLNSDERVKQSYEILNITDKLDYPTILTGDFNETSNGSAYTVLHEKLKDAIDDSDLNYFSYHDGKDLVRIDYILHTSDLHAESIKAIETDYSDHYPIISKFKI